MQLTNFLCVISLIASISAYPFMADYHGMTEAQRRDLINTAKGMATRAAVDICEFYFQLPFLSQWQ